MVIDEEEIIMRAFANLMDHGKEGECAAILGMSLVAFGMCMGEYTSKEEGKKILIDLFVDAVEQYDLIYDEVTDNA